MHQADYETFSVHHIQNIVTKLPHLITSLAIGMGKVCFYPDLSRSK